jgi:hypothetical protein
MSYKKKIWKRKFFLASFKSLKKGFGYPLVLVRGTDPQQGIPNTAGSEALSESPPLGFCMPGIPDGAVEGAVREAHPVDKDVDEVLALYEGTPDHAHLSARRLAHIRPHLHTHSRQSINALL